MYNPIPSIRENKFLLCSVKSKGIKRACSTIYVLILLILLRNFQTKKTQFWSGMLLYQNDKILNFTCDLKTIIANIFNYTCR